MVEIGLSWEKVTSIIRFVCGIDLKNPDLEPHHRMHQTERLREYYSLNRDMTTRAGLRTECQFELELYFFSQIIFL